MFHGFVCFSKQFLAVQFSNFKRSSAVAKYVGICSNYFISNKWFCSVLCSKNRTSVYVAVLGACIGNWNGMFYFIDHDAQTDYVRDIVFILIVIFSWYCCCSLAEYAQKYYLNKYL